MSSSLGLSFFTPSGSQDDINARSPFINYRSPVSFDGRCGRNSIGRVDSSENEYKFKMLRRKPVPGSSRNSNLRKHNVFEPQNTENQFDHSRIGNIDNGSYPSSRGSLQRLRAEPMNPQNRASIETGPVAPQSRNMDLNLKSPFDLRSSAFTSVTIPIGISTPTTAAESPNSKHSSGSSHSSVYMEPESDLAVLTTAPNVTLESTVFRQNNNCMKNNQVSIHCLLTISVECNVFSSQPYVLSAHDRVEAGKLTEFLQKTADALFIELNTSKLGNLRLYDICKTSLEGSGSWEICETFLFDKYLVVLSSLTALKVYKTHEILHSRLEPSGTVRLFFENSEILIKLNSEETARNWNSALHNACYQFPITSKSPVSNLLPPFNFDIIERNPVNLVFCVPCGIPIQQTGIPEVLGRIGSFDKIGIVRYGDNPSFLGPEKQSWDHWPEYFSRSLEREDILSEVSEDHKMEDSIQRAVRILKKESNSSIVLITTANTPINHDQINVDNQTIHVIGMGLDDSGSSSCLAAASGGYYTHVLDVDNLSQVLVNISMGERLRTHYNGEITLRSSLGRITSIEGIDRGFTTPVEPLQELSGPFSTTVIQIGSLRSGEPKTIMIEISVNPQVLEVFKDNEHVSAVEATVNAHLCSTRAPVLAQATTQVSMSQLRSTRSDAIKVFSGKPCTAENLRIACAQVAIEFCKSLKQLALRLDSGQLKETREIIQKSQHHLERFKEWISRMCGDYNFHIFISTLQAALEFFEEKLQRDARYPGQSYAFLLSMIWTLQTGVSFSRSTALEAYCIEGLPTNVF